MKGCRVDYLSTFMDDHMWFDHVGLQAPFYNMINFDLSDFLRNFLLSFIIWILVHLRID